MMWKTRLYYNDILNNRDSIAAKFKKGVPDWVWLERFGDRWPVRLDRNVCGGVCGLRALIVVVSAAADSLSDGAGSRSHHQLVRPPLWLRQFCGERYSQNLLPFDFLMMGESYHKQPP